MEWVLMLLNFDWLGLFGPWLSALSGLVAAMTVLTALTPTKVDNQILDAISKVVNVLAGNVLRNKNKDS